MSGQLNSPVSRGGTPDELRRAKLTQHSSNLRVLTPTPTKAADRAGVKGGLVISRALIPTVAATKEGLASTLSWMGEVGAKLLPGGNPKLSRETPSISSENSKELDMSDHEYPVGPVDVCTALRTAVEVKRVEQAVAALDMMSELAEKSGRETIIALGAGGACTYIDQLLSWCGSTQSLSESGLRAICSLVSEETLRHKFVSGGSSFRIVKIAQTQIRDEVILEWGLRIVRYLALDEKSLPKLFSAGACELVCLALNSHNLNDSIIEWSCRIVYAMSQDEKGQERFALGDACEAVVVGVLQERSEPGPSIEVAVWCLRAIGALSRRHAKNKERLANLGACEQTIRLFKQFGHENPTFAESFCWSVGNLAFPDEVAQRRLAAAGACTAVVKALDRHYDIPEVAQEGFRAIRNLGHLNDGNLSILADEKVCEVVMRAIKFHSSQTGTGVATLQWGWYAVASLSDHCENLGSLGAAGACQELIHTINSLVMSPDVMQWACLAISKLALDPEISKFIGNEGACVGLVNVLTVHIATAEVVEECFNAIDSLCMHEDGKNRDIFGESNISDNLVQSFLKHEREEYVVELASCALSRLTADGGIILSKLCAAGICIVLPKIVCKYPDNEKISEKCCQTIAKIFSSESVVHQSKLITAGAATAIVSSLVKHVSSLSACCWSLQSIPYICLHEEGLVKLKMSNAFIAISKALNSHFDHEVLSRLALTALEILFKDKNCKAKIGNLDGCAEALIESMQFHVDNQVLVGCGCRVVVEMCNAKVRPTYFSSSGNSSAPPSPASFIKFSDGSHSISAAEKLGMVGICPIVTSMLSKYLGNADILLVVSNAIEFLCVGEHGVANRARFSQCGLAELILRALRTAMDNEAKVSVQLLSSLCLAIAAFLQEGPSQNEIQNIFSVLDAPLLLGQLFLRFAENPILAQSCCIVVSLIASGNSTTQDHFLECGVVNIMASTFKRYLDKGSIVAHFCFAIAELSLNNDQISMKFGKLGICKDLVNVLLRHKTSEVICEACCRAVFSLKSQNSLLGVEGACEAVLLILAQHPGSEAVAQWVCRAIGSLAENQNNKKILGANSACEVITAALQRHVANETLMSVVFMRNTSSAGVAQWGCAAMYFLARGHGKLEEEYRKKLVAAGACEAVAKALVKYSEIETVAQACCRAVVVLVDGKDKEEYAGKLGNLGVCSTIVDSLHLFPSSVPLAKWGCRAVAVLAESCEANVVKLVAAGCCEVIPVAMQAHQTSEAVAGAGCDALTSLASNIKSGYAARLGHTGACESVVSVLRRHYANADVVERGCRAMANLALVKGNSSWFGPAGACDALLKVQRHHPLNDSLAAAAWLAAGSLCVDNNNRHRLGQAGACEQIVESMRTLFNFPAVAMSAGTAIGKLCEQPSTRRTHDPIEVHFANKSALNDPTTRDAAIEVLPCNNRENRERLSKAGCCEIIVETLQFHSDESSVALSLCRTIGILANGSQSTNERDQLGSVGGCITVVQVMKRFQSCEGVARNGCLAIRALAFDHFQNKELIRMTGGCEAVVDALRRHSQSATGPLIHEAAAWAVSNLAQDCPENKELFGSIGAVESVLDAFEVHGRYLEVARWCCSSLRHLCDGNEHNRTIISFSSAAELLSASIQKYAAEDELVECALLTMIVICADRVGQHRLGLVGSCKVVVQTLHRSDTITSLACELITALSFKSPDNQAKLGQAGACKAVLQALEIALSSCGQVGGNSRKNTSSTVLETMKDMASAVFTHRIASSLEIREVTCPPIATDHVEGTGTGRGLSILVTDCLSALRSLSTGHEVNRTKLISLGALDLLSVILNAQVLSEVAKEKAGELLESLS